MAKATVAYEARRKHKTALPKLRWHRVGDGVYRAEKEGKTFTVFSRSPDRRNGKLPWVVALGGVRGQELKSFDTAADAKEWAKCFNGQPPAKVIVQAAPGMPAGTYRGTLAAEGREPSDKYEKKVTDAVAKMIGQGRGPDGTLLPTSPDAYDIVGNSPEYVAQMEQGGIDPDVVAAVLVATKHHGHVHDVPGKHVDLAEAREDWRTPLPRSHVESHVFRGQAFTIFYHPDGEDWHYEVKGGRHADGYETRDEALAAAHRALGKPAGFSVAVEGAAEEAWRVPSSGGWDNDPQGRARYTAPEGEYRITKARNKRTGHVAYLVTLNHQDYGWSAARYPAAIQLVKTRPGKHLAPEGAKEAKKRLWQPDPSTGIFLTHSSITRDTWVLKGDRILGRFPTRGEAEAFAKDLVEKKA